MRKQGGSRGESGGSSIPATASAPLSTFRLCLSSAGLGSVMECELALSDNITQLLLQVDLVMVFTVAKRNLRQCSVQQQNSN